MELFHPPAGLGLGHSPIQIAFHVLILTDATLNGYGKEKGVGRG